MTTKENKLRKQLLAEYKEKAEAKGIKVKDLSNAHISMIKFAIKMADEILSKIEKYERDIKELEKADKMEKNARKEFENQMRQVRTIREFNIYSLIYVKNQEKEVNK